MMGKMMKTQNGTRLVGELHLSIESGDYIATLKCLDEIEKIIISGEDLIDWITEPRIITELHQKMMLHLDIPHRLLLLRNRVQNKHRRAMMFAKIMNSAVVRMKEVKEAQEIKDVKDGTNVK